MNEVADQPRLSIRGLDKSYASPVLRGIDLDLRPGEVHALVGANGAGKSTLARIISGLTAPDAGSMTLDGAPHAPGTKAAAERSGVQIVLQELNLIGTLSVAENVGLGRWPTRLGWIRTRALNAAAREALRALGLDDVDPSLPAGRLGVGRQQLVEIATALAKPCRLLILDEPTAALTDPQIDRLFDNIRRFRDQGGTILYISHRHQELQRIADRVSVLRDGVLVTTRATDQLSHDEAIRLMVGQDPTSRDSDVGRASRGPLALSVEKLGRGTAVRDVSFAVRHGEVLGIAGLIGSGRTELLRAIVGADPPDRGHVRLGANGAAVRFRSPREAVMRGIGLVPEDRKSEGLLLPLPVDVNATLARLRDFAGLLGWMRRDRERAAAESLRPMLDLRTRSVDQPVEQLSGGNQQKVLIGRWLLRDPDVYLLDEPTRGIDVAAKRTVQELIRSLAARGKAVVVVSSELEELMAISDRIAVMSVGRLVAEFERGSWTQESILAAAFEGHVQVGAGAGTGGACHE